MDPKMLAIGAGAAAGLVIGFVIGLLVKRGGTSRSGSDDVEPGESVELYAGNLSYDLNEKQLAKALAPHGNVLSVRIIKNKGNNRSKGYGFVEMATEVDANKVIDTMHGTVLMGRKLVVNEARSRSRD